MTSTINRIEEVASNHAAKIWVGIAVGTAMGLGFALSRRKRSRWEEAKVIGQRLSEHSSDLADASKDIIERIHNLYEESRKVVDDASALWGHGRKLVRH